MDGAVSGEGMVTKRLGETGGSPELAAPANPEENVIAEPTNSELRLLEPEPEKWVKKNYVSRRIMFPERFMAWIKSDHCFCSPTPITSFKMEAWDIVRPLAKSKSKRCVAVSLV